MIIITNCKPIYKIYAEILPDILIILLTQQYLTNLIVQIDHYPTNHFTGNIDL